MTSMNPTTMADPLAPSLNVARRGVDEILVHRLHDARNQSDDEGWQYGLDVVETFLLGSGKRVRPVFCHLGWRSVGGAGHAGIVQVAAALEMFHAFALIHDDVMDRSDLRRGRPTVHVSLERSHEHQGWLGDAAHFGRSAAILWGDLCLAWADDLLYASAFEPDQLTSAARVFRLMRTEVLLGQYLDIRGETIIADPAMCDRILQLKSARYTVQRPLQIGAVLAGAQACELDVLSRYGTALGTAFQLRDDVLGAFGEDAQTGKSASSDLRDGKSTLLMAITRQAASVTQSAVLDRWHGNADLGDEGLAALRQVIVDTGSLRKVEQTIAERTEQAVEILADGDLEEDARQALTAMAVRLGRRTS